MDGRIKKATVFNVIFKSTHKESMKAYRIAAITQLVEWLAVNQHVTGSSPVGGASPGPVA